MRWIKQKNKKRSTIKEEVEGKDTNDNIVNPVGCGRWRGVGVPSSPILVWLVPFPSNLDQASQENACAGATALFIPLLHLFKFLLSHFLFLFSISFFRSPTSQCEKTVERSKRQIMKNNEKSNYLQVVEQIARPEINQVEFTANLRTCHGAGLASIYTSACLDF